MRCGLETRFLPVMINARSLFLASPAAFALGMASISGGLVAADAPAASLSAADLAAKLNADRLDGTSSVRLRMEINGGGSIQIQTKERRSASGTFGSSS